MIIHTKSIFARHGIPKSVRSDNGPQFSAMEYSKFAEEWGFAHITSSPYHPQSNGLAEKSVQIIKQMLNKSKRDGQDSYLSLLELIIISPSNDYTTFQNNTSTLTFNCSGNGTIVLWTVDGYTTGTQYVLSKGIQYTPYIVSPDGPTVSTQLIFPTTKANRNNTVICITTWQVPPYNLQSSNPVRLILQGTA